MNLNYLKGKKFAIRAVSKNSKEETESAVFTGIARLANGHLFLDREDHKSFPIPDAALKQIKPVPKDMADILLNAEYYVPIYVAPIPDDANPQDYIKTCLKWPE
jgi:hypothetical protein